MTKKKAKTATLRFFIFIFVIAIIAVQILGTQEALAEDGSPLPTSIQIELPKAEAPSTPIRYKGNLDVLVIGRDFEDQYLRSASSLTVVTPHLDAIYNSWMSFDLEMSGLFVAGNTKNFYTEEGKSTDLLLLDEAAVNFKPMKGLDLRAGALNTKINPILSIMSENCFFGTVQKLTLANSSENIKVSIAANEAVPSSGTITHGLIDDAPNAYFLTTTLSGEFKVPVLRTKLSIATTRFEFGSLSSNVAADSRLIGNSPESFDGIGATSRFNIGFAGFETAASLKTDWTSRFSTELVASTIVNERGPSDRNDGYQAFAKIKQKFKYFDVVPSYGMFDMAADVTPASFTILPNRYHNRKGYTAELDIQLEKQKVVFFGSYTRANVLQESIYISDRDMYNLGVEAKYDFL